MIPYDPNTNLTEKITQFCSVKKKAVTLTGLQWSIAYVVINRPPPRNFAGVEGVTEVLIKDGFDVDLPMVAEAVEDMVREGHMGPERQK